MPTVNEMARTLKVRVPSELWVALLAHTRILEPFWVGAVHTFATRSGLALEKRNRHIDTIGTSFDLMNQWRCGTLKYVKARRNEIDSAISFLRNSAIETPNRLLRIAPGARNAAAALRTCLHISLRSYRDEQLPEILAALIYDVAAVRTQFPFDFGNLMMLSKPGDDQDGKDSFNAILERASHELGIGKAVSSLKTEVANIWNSFESPPVMMIPQGYWDAEGDGADAQFRNAAMKAFHGRN